MKVSFKLRFHTEFGQSLHLTGPHPWLGNDHPDHALPLQYHDAESWVGSLEIPTPEALPADGLAYHYLLREADGSIVSDWGTDRRLTRELCAQGDVLVVDAWNAAGFVENAFYTEPFKAVLLRERQTPFQTPAPANGTHTFKVKAPLLARGQTLCLLGSAAALGRWETTNPVLLNRMPGEDFLTATLALAGDALPLEYKYGVFDLERRFLLAYETGENRRLEEPAAPRRRVVVNDGFARLPAPDWKGAGVAIPVFSLRSESSFGVGEFADLKPLADWCAQTGLKLIQVLPVNDTTATHAWTDSYPYSAISAFALHPLYLNLAALATGRAKTWLRELEPERQRLNALPELDYVAVMQAKLAFLKRACTAQRAKTFQSAAYRKFFAENQPWLTPYAVFCCLRDKYGSADPRQWPAHQRCTPAEIAALADESAPDFDAVALHYFIQFHLHRQLQEAAEHAHARGVILKGDIAIGVSRYGADTWQAPELYDLSVQAGAPPDPFAEKGQNWSFPTYNWPRMMEDGFAWWRQRFAQMGHYFDAFRIDHILGFFRIWSIPAHAVEGIMGHFVPAIPVDPAEFAARGIPFDRARYLAPFITDAVLREMFGAGAEAVKATFLQPVAPGQFALRPEFATQRQVEEHFSERASVPPANRAVGQASCRSSAADELDESPDRQDACPTTEFAAAPTQDDQRLKLGLFELISNVLLFAADGDGGRQFHFRFHMEKTASFRALDAGTQARLRELYVDYFFRRQDGFWRTQAMQKLPGLKRATNMLICGEDLGLVPGCVPGVMKELGLLSLEIQRMPKTPDRAFARPAEAPYLSVVTPSTHDMSTLRGWWAEDAQLTQRFFNEELGRAGAAPADCSGELNEAIIRQHLASPAMWSIFQLQDLLGMDESLRREDPHAERINVPANPRHYWRYRMHLTTETLRAAGGFNARLRALVEHYGRA